MLLPEKNNFLLRSTLRRPLSGGRRHGATRIQARRRTPASRFVWVFSLVAGLTTVTIASIPDNDPLLSPPAADLPLQPPRQIVTVPQIDGTVSRVESDAPERGTENMARAAAPTTPSPDADWEPAQGVSIRVARGDTLVGILKDHDVSGEDINEVIKINPKPLYRLIPGQRITLHRDGAGRLQRLVYNTGLGETLSVRRQAGGGFEIGKEARELDTRLAYVTGTIESSLFADGQQAGLSDPLIMRLVEIFGWDIDFALDLRRGDSFSVIYEENYWLGQKLADGAIIGAEFINQGKVFRAVAHRDSENGHIEYYTPEGVSMRRPFLRTPVKFSRISSRFTPKRYHPILKRWRSHKGVDYAAPTGTPVRATATGRILFKGRKGGYGNTVIIQHTGAFSTVYAHLSRYNNALRMGSYVEQGDIIGYVGQSGLATGPHLHYEFRVNDVHRNPLTYPFPKAQPIADAHREEFLRYASVWSERLDRISGGRHTLLASRTSAADTDTGP